MATISYQNFFKLYNKLAGMTGTAATEAAEFSHIYNLEVIQIPTNLPLIRRDMTDLVFATEKGKFRTVVDEIIEVHESGRPILVGTVSIEKSELVAQLLEEKGVEDFQVLNAKYHEREAAIVANAGKRDAITIATNMAGRGTDIKLGEGVRELGGLAIIGTERHESRRIDNQLRGRCGRQGDPGSTRFFLSLEDEVARLFGGDRVKKIIDWIGADQMDDEPLSQRMVTRSIERAQRQVEEYNFEVRKHLLDYDDVMNRQRMIVYEMRRDVLEDRDITGRLQDMFANILDDIVAEYAPQDQLPDEWDLDGLKIRFKQVFGFEPDLVGEDEVPQQLPDLLQDQVNAKYKSHEAAMADYMREEFAEQIGGDDSHIDFPKFARKRIHDYELMALLNAVDDRWIEHLYSMDYLRESVRLRAYGQRDPLVEYKTEGFELFEQMMKAVEENVVQTLFRVTDPEFFRSRKLAALQGRQAAKDDTVERLSRYQYVSADKQQDRSFSVYDTSRFQLAGQASVGDGEDGNGASREEPKVKREPIRVEVRIGRNDPCPCGSGKKYKKCCGTENL
jgi:preprotein translocase subunit SecA